MRAHFPFGLARSAMSLTSFCAAAIVVATSFFSAPVHAQTLRRQAAPFSVWIDLREVSAGKMTRAAALPIWLDSVQFDLSPHSADSTGQSIYRLHFRRMSHLNAELHLRLFFDDKAGNAPTITGWSETGVQHFTSGPLGNGLD